MAIRAALDFIESRVLEPLSIKQVAGVTGFSVPHFRAVFAQATGRSLAHYITSRKLSHAAFELIHTDKQVSQIAMDYGFGSHDTFTRAFRRAFGDPPLGFRIKRRLVNGTLISPGIFGPAVHIKEEKVILIDKTHERTHDSSVLYGIAQVSYSNKDIEITPFPSALKACLNFLGQPTSYHFLMAVTGAAFRLLWNTNYWDGGNVDILGIRLDPTEPLRRAMAAVGRDYTLLVKETHGLAQVLPSGIPAVKTGGKREFMDLIKSELDAGRPVVGFGIVGPPEACVITGYRDDGDTLLGWNFFQDMPEFAASITKDPCGYFIRQDWYEYPETIAIMALGDQIEAPVERELLIDTLKYALEIMESTRVYERAAGTAAFEAWIKALLNEADFPKAAPLPMLMERLMCQVDGVTMVGERWRAYAYLHEQAERFPEVKDELEQAALAFRQENGLSMQMAQTIGGFAMGEKQALTLAKREVRENLAKLIQQAKELDLQAAEHMRKALGQLS